MEEEGWLSRRIAGFTGFGTPYGARWGREWPGQGQTGRPLALRSDCSSIAAPYLLEGHPDHVIPGKHGSLGRFPRQKSQNCISYLPGIKDKSVSFANCPLDVNQYRGSFREKIQVTQVPGVINYIGPNGCAKLRGRGWELTLSGLLLGFLLSPSSLIVISPWTFG